jgi:hypothetical protein
MTTPHTRRLATRILQLLLAATLLLPTAASAGESTRIVQATAGTPAPATYSAETFKELERLDDPTLEPRRAGHRGHERHRYHDHDGFSGGEIALTVVLLIVLFPIGLIVLIVLVVDHD